MAEKAQKNDDFPVPKSNAPGWLYVIIGNIGCGKTTMIERLSREERKVQHSKDGSYDHIVHPYDVIPEPVSVWTESGFLQSFYENMSKYALSFQMFAFATRAEAYKGIAWKLFGTYFADSHVISDRYVFAESLKDSGLITEKEIGFYKRMFDSWQKIVPEMNPTAFIYLRSKPETCKSRISMRGRKEEEKITIEYLKGLHDRFEYMSRMDQFNEKMYIIDVDGYDQDQVYNKIMTVLSER